MFEKILLAADGSPDADRAAEAAIRLAKELQSATVTILHVRLSAPPRSELARSHFDVKSLLLEQAHAAIRKTRERFMEEGIPYRLEVALGEPAKEIMALAERGNYGLIIIGNRGLTQLKEVLLGSVSHEVAHIAGCPVMIVK